LPTLLLLHLLVSCRHSISDSPFSKRIVGSIPYCGNLL
jgi:hypothetical protein